MTVQEYGLAELEKVRCVKGDTRPATFVISKLKNTTRAVETGLVWERTGIIVQTFAEAKVHCDSLGGRIPVIQELYGIIDTRTTALFHPTMFVRPVTGAAAPPRGILSQTIHRVDPDDAGPRSAYAVVAMVNGPWGAEDTTYVDDKQRDLLLRCVSVFVP